MNFKYFIIGIYLAFVFLILLMVFKSCKQNIDLETQDYYGEELKYQSQIDAKNLGNPFRDSFLVVDEGQIIRIRQPKSLISDSILLEFRKPDRINFDRNFRFIGSVIPALEKNKFVKGNYGLKIRLYRGNRIFLIEKKIKI